MLQLLVMLEYAHQIVSRRALDALLAAKVAEGWELAFCFPTRANIEAEDLDAQLLCVFRRSTM